MKSLVSQCSFCFENKKTKCCQGCQIIYYCSIECQKKAWVTHKTVCKKLQKRKDLLPSRIYRRIVSVISKDESIMLGFLYTVLLKWPEPQITEPGMICLIVIANKKNLSRKNWTLHLYHFFKIISEKKDIRQVENVRFLVPPNQIKFELQFVERKEEFLSFFKGDKAFGLNITIFDGKIFNDPTPILCNY